MHATLPEETLKKIKHVGKLLGSASYNLALEVELIDGRKVVLILLRENAKEEAKEGYQHLKDTLNVVQHKKIKAISKTAIMMIDEAEALSHAEIDYRISDQQFAIAKELYHVPPIPVVIDDKTYSVHMHPAERYESGPGYRLIEKMEGIEFNDLPNNTPYEKSIKHGVAYAVFLTELGNMLKGAFFDDDRHGNQLCVSIHLNKQQINLNLFDFGEMAIAVPEPIEIQQFAKAIQDLYLSLNNKKVAANDIDAILSKHIDLAITAQQPYRYLMRIRRGLLALQDFVQYLSKDDLVSIIKELAAHPEKMHPELAAALPMEAKIYGYASKVKNNLFGFFNRASVQENAMQAEKKQAKKTSSWF